MIASQNETVEKLKTGLIGMKGKLGELQTKRDQLVARAKMSEAQARVQDAVKSIDVLDPTSELGRFEDKVRRSEAQVAGQAELNAATADPWDELEASSTDAEVEARLAALKGAGTAAPQGATE